MRLLLDFCHRDTEARRINYQILEDFVSIITNMFLCDSGTPWQIYNNTFLVGFST